MTQIKYESRILGTNKNYQDFDCWSIGSKTFKRQASDLSFRKKCYKTRDQKLCHPHMGDYIRRPNS